MVYHDRKIAPLGSKMKRSFILERRNSEMIRSFRRQPKATGGNGGNEADSDERPVGQEVKTGASHAPNVGSIPARVTTPNCPKDGETPPAAFLRRAGQFVVSDFKRKV